jgi:hypothetical protein
MIRSMLASPWLPLLYWMGAVITTICAARHESLQRRLGQQEFQSVVRASGSMTSPRHHDSPTLASHPATPAMSTVYQPTRVWFPQTYVLRRLDSSVHRDVTGIATNGKSISTEPQTIVSAPITMLSIRVDPSQLPLANSLAIQCRTSIPITNAHGRNVKICGVVTQEVVSSDGKILIMAGSRVVGSGLLDPDNCRFKSDGLWSIIFDDTELKVEAELLDRPSGLPGILGQETSNEHGALQSETIVRDSRFIFIPKNAPFVLELHGEFLVRNLNPNSASN